MALEYLQSSGWQPLYCALQLFRGFPYIFCMMLDEGIYIPHLAVMPCRQDFFCKNYKLWWFFLAVAFIVRSEVPQLQLLLLPCLLGLVDEFYVRFHYFVIFVLQHVRLTFLRCFQSGILLYFPLLARRYRLDRVGFLCWYYYCSNPWTGVLCLSNEVPPIVPCKYWSMEWIAV